MPQLTAYPALASRMNTGLCVFDAIHPLGDSATRRLARLVGRPALSLLLAGMSLLRRRFAPVIPPKRTISRVQLRFQGSSLQVLVVVHLSERNNRPELPLLLSPGRWSARMSGGA
ncbi:MAG: hypothetical protein Q8N89_05125 [Azonexus sp.]|nr:hypothetical protein [Azonexus sp.]